MILTPYIKIYLLGSDHKYIFDSDILNERDPDYNQRFSKNPQTKSPFHIQHIYSNNPENYVAQMIKTVNRMKMNEIRSSILINIEAEIDIHDIVKTFENSYRKTFPFDKICFFDWNMFSNFDRSRRKSLLIPEPNKKYSDYFLDLSMKAYNANQMGAGLVNFNVEAEGEYILCEMHLVYLFQRIFLPIIEQFEPDFIIIGTNETMCSGKNSQNVIFNGDGLGLY